MKKKSQITMFIILGLVLIVIVSIFLYISKSTPKRQTQQSVAKLQETAIEQQPIKEFTTLCLDKVSKDAVKLIGGQGGYIYTSQGGTLDDFSDTDKGSFFIEHKKLKTAYNIKKPAFTIQQFSPTAPDYPWITFPYETASSNTKKFEGNFGTDRMLPLRSSQGQHSIQTQIETYIDNNLDNCLDFSSFEIQGYKIEKQKSKTQVVIGSKDISVRSEIPLIITQTQTKETLEIKDFSTTLKIRLEDMYYFIKGLIENDIKDITFKIQGHNGNSFFVRSIEDAYQKDDLIIISDEESLIDGLPFEYIFARENRIPALYYIKENVLYYPRGILITQDNLLSGYVPKAEDPDEDTLTFTLKALLANPDLPTMLNQPQINFRMGVSDGELADYQIIMVEQG
jgi:hypothetical protein